MKTNYQPVPDSDPDFSSYSDPDLGPLGDLSPFQHDIVCLNQILIKRDELVLQGKCLGVLRKPVGDDSRQQAVFGSCSKSRWYLFVMRTRTMETPRDSTGDRECSNMKILRECLPTRTKTGLGVAMRRDKKNAPGLSDKRLEVTVDESGQNPIRLSRN